MRNEARARKGKLSRPHNKRDKVSKHSSKMTSRDYKTYCRTLDQLYQHRRWYNPNNSNKDCKPGQWVKKLRNKQLTKQKTLSSSSEYDNRLQSPADKFDSQNKPTDNTREHAWKNDSIAPKLTIMYINADQLLNKLSELQALSLHIKLSVICIVEIKPKRIIAIQDSEIFIHGYRLATTSIQKSGWGVQFM